MRLLNVDCRKLIAIVALLVLPGCVGFVRTGGSGGIVTKPTPILFNAACVVTDGERAIEGATCRIVGTDPEKSGLTNAQGYHLIADVLGPGQRWMEARLEGYETATVEFENNRHQDVHLVLRRIRPPPLPQLRVDGRRMVTVDGRPFVWRGATAFRLVDYVADGRQADAVAFLDWAKKTGFNLVRVLASLCCWFDLTHAAGQAALPEFLQLANARGIYVEVTALAGTKDRGVTREEMRQHVQAVASIAAAATNAVLEGGNELSHPTQQDALKSPAYLEELRSYVPAGLPFAIGSNCCEEPDEPDNPETPVFDGFPLHLRIGNFLTIHPDRGRPTWHRTRHLRELEALSSQTGKYAVSDEAIGAGDQESGSRSIDPHEFFAQGALSRVFGFGATFHFTDGLHAEVTKSPIQQAAAEAFIAGTRIVPDDVELQFQNAGWPNSPVKGARFTDNYGTPNTTIRAYSGIAGDAGVIVLVGVTGDPGLELQHGWRAVGVKADRPGVRVLEIAR